MIFRQHPRGKAHPTISVMTKLQGRHLDEYLVCIQSHILTIFSGICHHGLVFLTELDVPKSTDQEFYARLSGAIDWIRMNKFALQPANKLHSTWINTRQPDISSRQTTHVPVIPHTTFPPTPDPTQ
jgi:hypothetical protein